MSIGKLKIKNLSQYLKSIVSTDDSSKPLAIEDKQEIIATNESKVSHSVDQQQQKQQSNIKENEQQFLKDKSKSLSIELEHKQSYSSTVSQKHFQSNLFETGRFMKLFKNIMKIGKGGQGSVYSAIHQMEENAYAIKKIKFTINCKEKIQNIPLWREVQTLMNQNISSNIIRYYSCWIEEALDLDSSSQYEFEDEEKNQETIHNTKTLSNILDAQEDEDSLNSQEESEQLIQFNTNQLKEFDDQSFIIFEKNETQNKESQYKQNTIQASSNKKITKKQTKVSQKVNQEINNERIPLNLYIQMELWKGDTLSSFIENKNRIIDRQINYKIIKSILEGLVVLHQNCIIHRDLKPSNIFLKESQEAILTDFGLSRKLQHQQQSLQNSTIKLDYGVQEEEIQLTNKIGTYFYMAPEIREQASYDSRIDIFSLGIIVYELFLDCSTAHEKYNVLMNYYSNQIFEANFKKNYPQELKLVQLLTTNILSKRPKSQEIYENPIYQQWVKSIENENI